MAGLPGDARELFIESMRKTIEIQPDFLRIYPTLVLEGTALAEAFREGLYAPLSLDEAVDWLAPAYDLAATAGISIIRMGLQSDPALEKPGVIIAGPYHPAFGYLVKCRWWRDRIDVHFASLSELGAGEIRQVLAGLPPVLRGVRDERQPPGELAGDLPHGARAQLEGQVQPQVLSYCRR